MKKCLILCMSCNHPFFQEEEKTILKTWASDIKKYPNLSIAIYSSSKDGKYHYNKKTHKILVPAGDDLYHTFDKTCKAFLFINSIDEFKNYDFILRTNCSTYINLKLLVKVLELLDENNIYCGITHCCPNSTAPFNWAPHPMGSCMILSKKLINIIIDPDNLEICKQMDITKSLDENTYNIDDTAIGFILNCFWIKNGEDPINHYKTTGLCSIYKAMTENFPVYQNSLAFSMRLYYMTDEKRYENEVEFIYNFHKQAVSIITDDIKLINTLINNSQFTVLLPNNGKVLNVNQIYDYYADNNVYPLLYKVQKPNIVWYTLCWNEIDILPFMINYWKTIANKVIVYDNGSDDGSVELMAKYDWIEIRPYPIETNNTVNDAIHQIIKNECWKEQKNKNVDWVIVSDLDETIWANNLFLKLKQCQENNVAIITPRGYDFVSENFPAYNGDYAHEIIKKCIYTPLWNKPIIFCPDKVNEINYAPGGHYLEKPEFTGINYKATDIYLFHFKYVGLNYLIKKRMMTKPRLSDANLKNGWGYEYLYNEQQIIEQFNGKLNQAADNIDILLNKKRYSVLTYIFGNYEQLREIKNKQFDVEYICVTDNPDLKSDTWKIILDDSINYMDAFNKTCYVRYHPWKYVTTDICFRIDGSIQINNSLDTFIDYLKYDYDCGYIIHPLRNNFIDEYNTWIRKRKYPTQQAEKCLNFMIKNGYNFDYKGLIELCFSIQKNNKINNDINEMTYSLLKYLGQENSVERIDQIILTFVIHHFVGENNVNVLPLSEEIIIDNSYLCWYYHGSNEKNIQLYDNESYKHGYLFNKEQDLIYLKKINN